MEIRAYRRFTPVYVKKMYKYSTNSIFSQSCDMLRLKMLFYNANPLNQKDTYT